MTVGEACDLRREQQMREGWPLGIVAINDSAETAEPGRRERNKLQKKARIVAAARDLFQRQAEVRGRAGRQIARVRDGVAVAVRRTGGNGTGIPKVVLVTVCLRRVRYGGAVVARIA